MDSSDASAGGVRRFYDRFSDKLLWDYLHGNRRIAAQLGFLADAIPRSARRVLVVGCGSGEGPYYLARHVAPSACVVAVDLSAANIVLARRLFRHHHIAYRVADALDGPIEGPWDVIVLPDVYEHIPAPRRAVLHAHLRTMLAPSGMIALTLPSPAHQAALRERGEGLQPVDETVTLADLQTLANDVGGEVTFFSLMALGHMPDYIHALVERSPERMRLLAPHDCTRLRRSPPLGWAARAWALAGRLAGRALRFLRVAWYLGLRKALAHCRPPRATDASERGSAP